MEVSAMKYVVDFDYFRALTASMDFYEIGELVVSLYLWSIGDEHASAGINEVVWARAIDHLQKGE